MNHSSPNRQGVALILTLLFIVIITVLAVGFMTSARVERASASSHVERARANSFARLGVERAVATLQRETSDRTRNWVSQPGVLTVPAPGIANKTHLRDTVYLSSGAPSPEYLASTNSNPDLRAANLNVQTLQDQGPKSYLIMDPPDGTSDPVEMEVRWIYIRQDGTLELPNSNEPISAQNLPNESPNTTIRDNPIVGRYAFWADDESAKVNYNLAWTRDPALNKNLPGHQTKVDMRALPGFEERVSSAGTVADALHAAITPDNYGNIRRFFNSPLDARRISGPRILTELGLAPQDGITLRTALDRNKFNVTHYNHDPDTTYYGTPRMVLTTQLGNAVQRDENGKVIVVGGKPLTRPFLDILKRTPDSSTSFLDPGPVTSIDPNKLAKVVNELVNDYLKKSDWPMVDGTGHSLQEKYYTGYNGKAREQRLAQIALNIIDYVRSAESRKPIVEPIRGKYVGDNFVPDFHNTNLRGEEDTFKGLVRAPYITEMGVWMSDKPETQATNPKNVGKYRTLAFVEVYLPKDYGIDSLDLMNTEGKPWYLYFREFGLPGKEYYLRNGDKASYEYPVTYRASQEVAHSAPNDPVFVWEAIGNRNMNVMRPGDYRTLVMEVWHKHTPQTRPTTVNLRASITVGFGPSVARIDVAPLGDPNKPPVRPLNYTLAPNDPSGGGDPRSSISTYETTDPRVNGTLLDWKLVDRAKAGAPNSLGAVNFAWRDSVGKPPLDILPEQDLDENGLVSMASMRMPYPVGHAKNLTGRVRSPGELGLIHTGIEGSSSVGKGGIPFRSLHLQPSKQPTTVVPDWAFMDLFTVPVDVPQKAAVLFAPHGNSTGGRVNMNAKPEPFDMERIDPLAAVLSGARTSTLNNDVLSPQQARTVAENIYYRLPAKAGKLPGGKAYPDAANTKLQVYDSPGEVVEIRGVADRGEESEELVREIANLITARGNVFSIYTVGQALKQTPTGKLIVTAEQRQQALVERHQIDKNSTSTTDDEIGFRSVYFRNLTP